MTRTATSTYDTISAFIKSLRGSDADAALYWMAKMIYAGEDPRFIFRRMAIFAGEDVGMADPQAMSVVVNCLGNLRANRLAGRALPAGSGGHLPGDRAQV
jgi:replication-associated recombination protein RarA